MKSVVVVSAIFPFFLLDFAINEIFINLNRVKSGPSPGFDQEIYKQLRFDVGYMNQYINTNGNRDRMNHILWLGTSQNF